MATRGWMSRVSDHPTPTPYLSTGLTRGRDKVSGTGSGPPSLPYGLPDSVDSPQDSHSLLLSPSLVHQLPCPRGLPALRPVTPH